MKIRKYQNGGTTFDYKETPRQKGERLLIDLELGSRFDSEGKRKKGEEKKLAKEMREFTGLEKEKMERQAEKKTIPARFRGRGQEGLDAYRAMMARKRRRGGKSGFEKLINALTLSFLTRRGEEKMRSQSSGAGSGCEKTGTCGAFD